MTETEAPRPTLNDHVEAEDSLLKALRELWIPHRKRDLEVRFKMGALLNEQLGPPAIRQSYGIGTIDRVSRELDLDKSDISRIRRFAALADSFEAFEAEYPEATSWSRVRELVVKQKNPDRPVDRRALWGLLRSSKSIVSALETSEKFHGPMVRELCEVLQKLYPLAESKLGFKFGDENSDTAKTVN